MNSGSGYRLIQMYPNKIKLLYIWSPLMAINNTSPNNNVLMPYLFYLNPGIATSYAMNSNNTAPFTIGSWHLSYWDSYLLISVGMALLFLILSIWLVKPRHHLFPRRHLAGRSKKMPATV
ncbi:hypothetical protein [Dictyobacter vulcani]|nr:hypothetical protein [Dictyobacter vulcani]